MPGAHYPSGVPSARQGRFCILAAAVLWSLSALFTRLLQQPGPLGLDEPRLGPIQITFYRALFAGLFFLPMLRPRGVRFRPVMLTMVLTFAAMNGLFITALAEGTAANTIWLQYTAPIWMVVMAVLWLGEPADRRGVPVLGFGMIGVAVIVFGGPPDQGKVVAMALGSGIAFAGVLVCLRFLNDQPGGFLTAINLTGTALCFLPLVWGLPIPSPTQFLFLATFGVVQLGLPYWLMSRGLRSVSPQEAGMIALLEPILNPAWAYLVAPERETPSLSTWIGASLILAALLWRYRPGRAGIVHSS